MRSNPSSRPPFLADFADSTNPSSAMRGRLRVVSDDNLKTCTWAEVPDWYWLATLEDHAEVPIIEVPAVPEGSEVPTYGGKHL